ncbi:MAG: response regulator [Bacteroidota bacterium]|nr:response regulator [Bacteroidota bacterium]
MNSDIQAQVELTSSETEIVLGKVLIVEDESLIGWSVANTLKRAGYRVTVVETGEEALEIINSTQFDLIITDFKLPKISGFEVATHLKTIYPKVPVVMMSAYEESRAMLSMFKPKIDYFIQKPFDMSEIATIVRRFTT